MKDLPIGFLDSGYGGLTVIKQSLKQLPNESIIYIGDSARAPYGPRSAQEVKEFTWQLTNFLSEKGIKMLVMACNTATAAALNDLRAVLHIPVVGVIHSGSRSAIKLTSNNRVGVIGTQGTINSGMYSHVMSEKNNQLTIFSRACPEFVTIVEQELIETPETDEIIAQSLQPFKEDGVDTLVLGCTHYPLLYHKIRGFMGDGVTLIDSGVETINEVSTVLDYFNLSRTAQEAKDNPSTIDIYTTGNGEIFEKFTHRWLGREDIEVKEVMIQGGNLVEDNNR